MAAVLLTVTNATTTASANRCTGRSHAGAVLWARGTCERRLPLAKVAEALSRGARLPCKFRNPHVSALAATTDCGGDAGKEVWRRAEEALGATCCGA